MKNHVGLLTLDPPVSVLQEAFAAQVQEEKPDRRVFRTKWSLDGFGLSQAILPMDLVDILPSYSVYALTCLDSMSLHQLQFPFRCRSGTLMSEGQDWPMGSRECLRAWRERDCEMEEEIWSIVEKKMGTAVLLYNHSFWKDTALLQYSMLEQEEPSAGGTGKSEGEARTSAARPDQNLNHQM